MNVKDSGEVGASALTDDELSELLDVGLERSPKDELSDRWWREIGEVDPIAAQRVASSLSRYSLGTLEYWRRAALPDPKWVYFIGGINRFGYPSGPIKVGYAADPVSRLVELQTGNPEKLVVWEVVLGSRDLEAHLHRQWCDLCVRGEWFDCSVAPAFMVFRAYNAAAVQAREYTNGRRDPFYLDSVAREQFAPPAGAPW